MSRKCSPHESAQKFRTPPTPLSDRDKGILARIHPTVMASETRPFNYNTRTHEGKHQFPAGAHIGIRVCTKSGVHNGTPFIEVGGFRGVTLIEKPQDNRLRVLWQNGWWVEVQLDPFKRLLELAATCYGSPLPEDLTTLAVRAEFITNEA
jgi:hypothetical protein